MLTAKNLERVMELEEKLRSEYQSQLDAKSAAIEGLEKKLEEQRGVIEKQLEQITILSAGASDNKRIEQLNRELTHRSERLEEEVASQKKRLKSLQKDLAEERALIKELKRFDAVALKKNLDASKKKLVEKSAAADLLQKSLNKSRAEYTELQQKLKELEEKLPQSEEAEEAKTETETEAAAA